LTWKNYLIKKRSLSIVLAEMGYPILNLMIIPLQLGLFTKKGSAIDAYFTGQDWYVFVYYLTIVTGSFITLA
jgi:hypothetical protein